MSSFRRFFGLLPPKHKPVVKAKFVAIYRCAACKEKLSFSQIMYSHGICPKCGHVTNGTVCDYAKEAKDATTS